MAARWVTALPRTFSGPDFVRLLAEFVLALARLRAAAQTVLRRSMLNAGLTHTAPVGRGIAAAHFSRGD